MSRGTKRHIAIVDDDALVQEALGDCMESAGYPVERFGSAEDFLASDSTESAACLIVDIQLPGITGLELQGRLAGAENRVPIVFVTAHGTNANRDRAVQHGASGFLSKPVRREELLNAVRAAIQD
ncbi:MAG: response regulator [Bryobacteraceae bacterium]|jgi:FixJ family two-component response regulator